MRIADPKRRSLLSDIEALYIVEVEKSSFELC